MAAGRGVGQLVRKRISFQPSLNASQVILQDEHLTTVRSYANKAAPSDLPPLKGDELLKSIFYEVKNQYETAYSILRKEKITLAPEDPAAVSHFAKIKQTIREKAGLLSESQKIEYNMKRLTDGIPDARTYLLKIKEFQNKHEVFDEHPAEPMMMEALDKIEKEIGKPLLRSEEKNMARLHAEFEKIYKKTGIRKEDLPKYEQNMELDLAKQDLEDLKQEAIEAMETQLKREEFKGEKMPDVKTLDLRNFL